MEKNDHILLNNIQKFFMCTRLQVYKAVIAKKLIPERTIKGDNRMYVKREEIEKLFKHRKANKENNND